MADKIKAMETIWAGYRFRSRLEARWAVFFNALGIKYEYEPEGFTVKGGYLPDFYLPEYKVFFEIKHSCSFTKEDDDVFLANEEDRNKIEEFHKYIVEEANDKTLIVVSGDPYDFLDDKDNIKSSMYTAACCSFALTIRAYPEMYEGKTEAELDECTPNGCSWKKCNNCELMKKFVYYTGYVNMLPSDSLPEEGIFPQVKPSTEYMFVTGPGEPTALHLLNINSLRWYNGDPDYQKSDGYGKLLRAATKARQARFEHGDIPEVVNW